MVNEGEEWFRNWFDSPYYHLLYQYRDEQEARLFLDHILNYLQLPAGADILDIPCGKGRHALYLQSLGFNVSGMDLSPANISLAQSVAGNKAAFSVHDMRQQFGSNIYDCIFNLFTSLGYFKWEHENLQVIQNLATALKPGGNLIIDFFNPKKISSSLYPESIIEAEGIQFHIKRSLVKNRVVKQIQFEHQQRKYHFEEHVMLISRERFSVWFKMAGLKTEAVFGSYKLDEYNEATSERLIFLLKKA
jgi:SAM-dependent methyltransferase